MIPVAIFIFILIELFFVTLGDIKTEKIPNFWSLLNVIVYFVLLFVAPSYYVFDAIVFLYPITFIIIGFLLFSLRIMGAGDSKYLATFFLIVPISMHDLTFHSLLMSTLLIGTFVFITNFTKNFSKIIHNLKVQNYKEVKNCFGTKFAYAPVIMLTWIWVGWKIKIFF